MFRVSDGAVLCRAFKNQQIKAFLMWALDLRRRHPHYPPENMLLSVALSITLAWHLSFNCNKYSIFLFYNWLVGLNTKLELGGCAVWQWGKGMGIWSVLFRQKWIPPDRIWTSDLWMSYFPLQSTALPTELPEDCFYYENLSLWRWKSRTESDRALDRNRRANAPSTERVCGGKFKLLGYYLSSYYRVEGDEMSPAWYCIEAYCVLFVKVLVTCIRYFQNRRALSFKLAKCCNLKIIKWNLIHCTRWR